MIASGSKENFFVAHYDWLVAGVGVLALVGGGVFFALGLGDDADVAASQERARIERMKPSQTGVKPLEMKPFADTLRLVRKPTELTAPSEKDASFLSSERRVKCKCGRIISGNVELVKKCPYCGEAQEMEKAIVIDADGDGMPDAWEKKFGFNLHDPSDAAADKDEDGFTNLEEFTAKTSPIDPDDHPDYLESVKVTLPLKETYLPFVFRKANQIPGGWRCEFLDSSRKNDYGRLGRTVTAKVGEKIIDGSSKENFDYGYTIKSYTPKTAKKERKGMAGMYVTVDVSEVVVVRERDKKEVKMVIQTGKKVRPEPVDVQATLIYERGGTKSLDVVPGSEITLNREKYKVDDIKPVGKGAEVIVHKLPAGKKITLRPLEQ